MISCALTLCCAVCGNDHDSDATRAGQQAAALFGATPYAICSGCSREIPREHWTTEYKRRWTKRARRIAERDRVLVLIRTRTAEALTETWWHAAALDTTSVVLEELCAMGEVERTRSVVSNVYVYRAKREERTAPVAVAATCSQCGLPVSDPVHRGWGPCGT